MRGLPATGYKRIFHDVRELGTDANTRDPILSCP
jgi:hypothetical protein